MRFVHNTNPSHYYERQQQWRCRKCSQTISTSQFQESLSLHRTSFPAPTVYSIQRIKANGGVGGWQILGKKKKHNPMHTRMADIYEARGITYPLCLHCCWCWCSTTESLTRQQRRTTMDLSRVQYSLYLAASITNTTIHTTYKAPRNRKLGGRRRGGWRRGAWVHKHFDKQKQKKFNIENKILPIQLIAFLFPFRFHSIRLFFSRFSRIHRTKSFTSPPSPNRFQFKSKPHRLHSRNYISKSFLSFGSIHAL